MAPLLPRLVTTSTLMPVAAVNSAPTCCSIPIALPVPPTRNVSAAALGPATSAQPKNTAIATLEFDIRMVVAFHFCNGSSAAKKGEMSL